MTDKETYEPDRVLDHDYDGIQEYDNRLPNWWLWTLWGTVVFSVVYWLAFHTYGWAKNPVEKYEAQMEIAAETSVVPEEPAVTEADLLRLSSDPEVLAEGQSVYDQYCKVCHLAEGQGLVGPNLTDEYWIHGGSALDIHDVVVNGVVEKGMAAWGRQLGPGQVDAVVAHLLTLRGKNIEGKAPQGELYRPDSAEPGAVDPAASGAEDATSTESVSG